VRILVDTNIFLDILLQRPPFFKDSHRIFKMVESSMTEGFIAPITINNIAYIARKSHLTDQIRKFIVLMAETFTICTMDSTTVRRATGLNFTDIEDSLQAAMAEAHECDFIITSNGSDYKHSAVPAMSATAFFDQFMST
jgi:predicted nucleic acid-binding protein